MIVALRAAERAAHPDVGHVAHAVGCVDGEVFLFLDAAFVGGLQQAVVAGGDALFERGVWQEIAGELLPGELVEWQIGVEGIDDVVAVRGNAVILVAVIADRIGVADQVQPVAGQSFAEAGRGQQFVDQVCPDFVKVSRLPGQRRRLLPASAAARSGRRRVGGST